jgi:dihydroflavonol-4-reductase
VDIPVSLLPMKSRVLITGATGLLGMHVLLEELKRGSEVMAMFRSEEGKKDVKRVFRYYGNSGLFDKILWTKADVLDIETLKPMFERAQRVYHAAALVSFDPRHSQKLYKTNVFGTRNVVNLCLEYGVEKLVYVSSTAAIGKTETNTLLTEEAKWTELNGNSHYAQSKYLAEQEVWRGIEEGLHAVMVNPCIILGPGNWAKSSSTLFHQVKKGLRFYTRGSNAFVDVRDVAESMVLLMDSRIHSERFLAVGENASFKDVFSKIARAFDVSPPKTLVSGTLLKIAWRSEAILAFLSGKSPRISEESVAASERDVSYSNRKIKSQIPITFRTLDEAIENGVKFYNQD